MRLFLASSFPDEVLRDLNERVAQFKSRLPAASWVRPETQHLTFAFLGDQHESIIDAIGAPLQQSLAAVPPFEASLHGCGFFPNPRHARVGWVGLEPEKNFGEVARAVREVVTKNGVELDRGDFKPHLTLMRIRDPWPPASIDLFNRALRDYRSATFPVEHVTLYSSELNPRGAVHTPLRKFPLSAP